MGVSAGAQLVTTNAKNTMVVIIFPIFFISFFSSIEQDQIEVLGYNGNASENNGSLPATPPVQIGWNRQDGPLINKKCPSTPASAPGMVKDILGMQLLVCFKYSLGNHYVLEV